MNLRIEQPSSLQKSLQSLFTRHNYVQLYTSIHSQHCTAFGLNRSTFLKQEHVPRAFQYLADRETCSKKKRKNSPGCLIHSFLGPVSEEVHAAVGCTSLLSNADPEKTGNHYDSCGGFEKMWSWEYCQMNGGIRTIIPWRVLKKITRSVHNYNAVWVKQTDVPCLMQNIHTYPVNIAVRALLCLKFSSDPQVCSNFIRRLSFFRFVWVSGFCLGLFFWGWRKPLWNELFD